MGVRVNIPLVKLTKRKDAPARGDLRRHRP